MKKTPPIIIAGVTFGSQKLAAEYVREILARNLSVERISDPTDINFLMALIARHERADEKRGSGVDHFIARPNDRGLGNALVIKRTDGTETDISWLNGCIARRPNTPAQNRTSAMREAIRTQINQFRRTQASPNNVCELCGSSLYDPTHIDHVVHFETLVAQFEQGRTDIPQEFDDFPPDYRAYFKPEDTTFANDWIAFHQANAQLRIVHQQCNLTRAKAEVII